MLNTISKETFYENLVYILLGDNFHPYQHVDVNN